MHTQSGSTSPLTQHSDKLYGEQLPPAFGEILKTVFASRSHANMHLVTTRALRAGGCSAHIAHLRMWWTVGQLAAAALPVHMFARDRHRLPKATPTF